MPLLSNAPLAQNELVRTLRGLTVLVSRFHKAPHAEWLLICSGSSDARSKKMTRVGETTIDSSATIPDRSALRSKRQPGAAGAEGAAAAKDSKRGKMDKVGNIILAGVERPRRAQVLVETAKADIQETRPAAYIAERVQTDGRRFSWVCSREPPVRAIRLRRIAETLEPL